MKFKSPKLNEAIIVSYKGLEIRVNIDTTETSNVVLWLHFPTAAIQADAFEARAELSVHTVVGICILMAWQGPQIVCDQSTIWHALVPIDYLSPGTWMILKFGSPRRK